MACVSPGLEKPKVLLTLRIPDLGVRPTSSLRDNRRSANVGTPLRQSGLPETRDVSVSSIMRPATFASAAPGAASVFAATVSRKCAYLNTAARVADTGALFRLLCFTHREAAGPHPSYRRCLGQRGPARPVQRHASHMGPAVFRAAQKPSDVGALRTALGFRWQLIDRICSGHMSRVALPMPTMESPLASTVGCSSLSAHGCTHV